MEQKSAHELQNERNERNEQSERRADMTGIWIQLLFVLLVAMFVLVIFVAGLFMTRPTHSDAEKRDLQRKPSFSVESLVNGDYFRGLSAYYNDTVPMRDDFKLMGSKLLNFRGVSKNGIIMMSPGGSERDPNESVPTIFNPDSSWTPRTPRPPVDGTASPGPDGSEPPATPTATPTAPTVTTPPATPSGPHVGLEYQNEGLIVYDGRALELFGGSEARMNQYISAMNRLHRTIPEINLYSMNIPIAVEFYVPDAFKNQTSSQKAAISYILSHLDDGIYAVNAYDVLQAHAAEDIYFRTEHHWTFLGAYYAAQEFAKTAGVPFRDLSAYEARTREGFLGSFYNYYGCKVLAKYPETVTYYVPDNPHTIEYFDGSLNHISYPSTLFVESVSLAASYYIVMGDDAVIPHITTQAGTGRRLVIFKDSYGNILPEYMLDGFDEVWVIDIRAFKLDAYDFLWDHQITDVLFASCMFTNAGPNAVYYDQLFY